MKKIFLLFLLTTSLNYVYATDITDDIEIKYRWYQNELVDGIYYPKKDKLPDYLEDKSKVEYGEYSPWQEEYCSYDRDNYLIETKNVNTYQKINKVKYMLIQTASTTCRVNNCVEEVEIYYNHQKINHRVLADDSFGTLIEFPEAYEPEKLVFYIKSDHIQIVFLSHENVRYHYDINSYPISERLSVVTEDWNIMNTDDSMYDDVETEEEIPAIPFIRNISSKQICRVREIKTYRYKLAKNYYDDNYYSKLDNYLPDFSDYRITYTKPFPTTKIEVTKEVPVTKVEKEYIYENSDDNTTSLDEADQLSNEKIVYQTIYQDKIVSKIPLKIYIIIVVLSLIIVLGLIKKIAKKVG